MLKSIKLVKLSNFTEIYSLANKKKYDMDDLMQKYLLYKQFAAWCCNGCSTVPLRDYINNLIYQELIDEDQYGSDKRDERIYLDLRPSSGYANDAKKLERNDSKISLDNVLENAATKKLRQRIWVHSVGEYLYDLLSNGLTLHHKTYSISQQDNNFLE